MKNLLTAVLLALNLSNGPALVPPDTRRHLAAYTEDLSDSFEQSDQVKNILNQALHDPSEERVSKAQSILEDHILFLNRMRARAISTELHAQHQVNNLCSADAINLWVLSTSQIKKQNLWQPIKNWSLHYAARQCRRNLEIIDFSRMRYSVAADETKICKKIKATLDKLSTQCS